VHVVVFANNGPAAVIRTAAGRKLDILVIPNPTKMVVAVRCG
jgi:hypothetical protein